MKVLITGARGMLATDLAAALQKFFSVTGADRQDLQGQAAISNLCTKTKPDVVFHTAAYTHVDGCESDRAKAFDSNVELTKQVVEACNACGALLIFFSTDYVFDGRKNGEYQESDAPNPLNYYGETKLLAEKIIQQKSARYVIIRISWLFGIHGKSFPKTILDLAAKQDHFEIVRDQMGRPTYTKDVAVALAQWLNQCPDLRKIKNQIYHLANQGAVSWADFATAILKIAGYAKAVVKPITSEQINRPAKRPANSVLSTAGIERDLGIRLRPWQDAIEDFVHEYHREKALR